MLHNRCFLNRTEYSTTLGGHPSAFQNVFYHGVSWLGHKTSPSIQAVRDIEAFPLPQLPPHIEELIRAGESETVEFKETTGTLNQAFQTVCAMLNGNGGTVLIGVKDDRSYADFTVGADTNHKISSHIRELIPAAPVHVAHHEREGNRHIIELHVGKGTFKPYTSSEYLIKGF